MRADESATGCGPGVPWLKVLAQMKSILIIGAGIVVYSDVVSVQTAIGYFTSIVGFGFYNYAKIKAKEQDDAAEATSGVANFDADPEKMPLVGVSVRR